MNLVVDMMKLLTLVPPFLMAVGKKPTHWFVDGNNVLGHGKTTKDRDSLIQTLQSVDSAEELILVFDGTPGAAETDVFIHNNLRTVSLAEGLSSDDFIQEEIERFWKDPVMRRKHRVNLVSADRELRQRTLEYKPIVKTVVNPVTFFRRYLPRMLGLKKPSANITGEPN